MFADEPAGSREGSFPDAIEDFAVHGPAELGGNAGGDIAICARGWNAAGGAAGKRRAAAGVLGGALQQCLRLFFADVFAPHRGIFLNIRGQQIHAFLRIEVNDFDPE